MAENGWARCPQPQKNTGVPSRSQVFPVVPRRSQAFSICKRYGIARLRQPPPVTTQKKQSSKRRPLLVGLPGFVLRKDIFEVEPIPLKKGADRRSSNKSLSYRLNQPPRESGSPTTDVAILSNVACKNSLLLCECSAMCCLQQSKHYTCIDARRAFASAIIQFA